MKRRDFSIKTFAAAASLMAGMSLTPDGIFGEQTGNNKPASKRLRKIIFRTQTARLGIINEDGSGLEYLKLDIPGQVGWGYGPVFSDRNRIILTSYEDKKVWQGNVMSHMWVYDLRKKSLTEIAMKNRPANFNVPCAILPGEKRLVTGPIIDGEQLVFTMNLDGSEQKEITKKGEGFTYGVSLSPDGKKLAFHVTNTMPYSIFSINIDGTGRTLVATHPDHLYFGTSWSPDGQWILYQDCHFKTDPGHDWSDLCIGRPDGSETRLLTEGLRHWFGTSYGTPDTRGSGSNMPKWSPDGSSITYTRAKPDSRTAWQWAENRPDTDHFNRDYKPEEASGGTDICLIDVITGEITSITENEPLVWDFRTVWSPDGEKIAFCRARIGAPSELWIMDSDGKNQKFLTRGEDEKGVDHPGFLG